LSKLDSQEIDADNHSFYFNLPVGAFSIIMIIVFFKTPPKAKVTEASWTERFLQMDLIGITLVMAGIVSFILAFEYGGQRRPWNSSIVIGLLVGFVLICVTFIAWEYFNNSRSMLQLHLIRKRFVWLPSTFQFFFAS
jgi:hypothetical protein